MQLKEMSPPFSLLLWFAVHDHVEDILEHHHIVQVSEQENKRNKNIVVQIHLFYFGQYLHYV